uniref:V-SNARE coiled-coil homology domain-containing protein n=1 Tax=Sinocyclocheilus rhinocerous TaxID=307959 RepID=A0A673LR68_9TELE
MENGQSSLRQAQQDVEDIKVIMLDNINKADERAGKLGELEDRADKLLSEQFSKTSTKVKQKKRWENIKYKVIIAAVVAAVLLGIIVAVAVSLSREDSKNTPEDTSAAQAPGDG